MLPLAIGTYALVMIVVGWAAAQRVTSEEDYLVAGRRLPLWLAWGTLLATWFGAATIIGASEAAREEGVRGTLLDPFASGLALIAAGLFFARRMWEMKLLTMGDFFAVNYGPKTERVSSIVQAIGYYPWLAAQYLALGGILHNAFGWDTRLAIVVAATFVLYLTMSGGMWSVTLTDTLQAFILLLTVVVLAYAMMKSIGGGSAVAGVQETWQKTEPDFRTLLPESYWLAWMAWTATLTNGILGNIPGQDLMQRIFASRSARTAMWACLLAGAIYILFGLAPVMLGLASKQVLPEGETQGVLHALAQLHLNPIMQIVFTVSLLSIVVSTATSALLSPSALLAHNVLGHWEFFNRRKLLTDRATVFASALVSLPMALLSEQVLDLLEAALAVGLVALVVPYLGGFYGRPRGEMPGLLSVIVGIGVWIAYGLLGWSILPGDIDSRTATPWQSLWLLPPELIGLAASTVAYFVGQSIAKRRSGEMQEDVGN